MTDLAYLRERGRKRRIQGHRSGSGGYGDRARRLAVGENLELRTIRNFDVHLQDEGLLRTLFARPYESEPGRRDGFTVGGGGQTCLLDAVGGCIIRDRNGHQERCHNAYKKSFHWDRPPIVVFGAVISEAITFDWPWCGRPRLGQGSCPTQIA